MPAGSLLALLDDITSVLDDVSALTKVAASKTAGVLGDDLALNAQQVSGVDPSRELPVVWAVARGSLVNKAVLVPAALAISALAPWAISPLLMAGGLYLCFEGVEKLAHALHRPAPAAPVAVPADAAVPGERDKIRGAVRTDFILSAEIIVIALGTVAEARFGVRLAVLAAVAVAMTVGVYGLVAAIVKLDDLGLHLCRRAGAPAPVRALGRGLLWSAPRLMRALAVVGTAAMFLVGGGILLHGLHALAAPVERLAAAAAATPAAGTLLGALVPPLAGLALGVLAGALALGLVALAARVRARLRR
jgi:predicted DNA repair protein MutK